MIPVELQEEVTDLQEVGYQIVTKVENNKVYLIFKNYHLPQGIYTVDTTDLLVWTGVNYPSCAFDMFWVDNHLLLKGGSIPRGAGHIEPHLGVQWRRFSIHPYNHKPWNPGEDSLLGFLSYINKRLKEGV